MSHEHGHECQQHSHDAHEHTNVPHEGVAQHIGGLCCGGGSCSHARQEKLSQDSTHLQAEGIVLATIDTIDDDEEEEADSRKRRKKVRLPKQLLHYVPLSV